MTRLLNAPSDFPAESLAGFVQAFPRYVQQVYGGVVRSTRTAEGKVALVVGGGSGHYPAFAGWVGQGFADGAVCGNIFSSPSGAQAYSVCKAADRGAGVLIGFGNYAGDVLHFGQAVERLRSEDIDARTIVVTDDIASGPPEEHTKRRGIAGDLPVFKVTAAACEQGMDIDEVVAVFERANEATRSFGVAFDGCTLPGADHPLFTVPEGRMGIGLGIHGEPGVDEADLGTADDVARLLVDGLLADRPASEDGRVVAVLNGLGGTKYEEMFVVWGAVSRLLAEADVRAVDQEVGELVTSLDMAGISLTLMWVDDELLALWDAPCDTPAYRRGAVDAAESDVRELPTRAEAVAVTEPGSAASRELAAAVVAHLTAVHAALGEHEVRLGDLDAVAGDGDHGTGMLRGCAAAVTAATDLVGQDAGAGTALVGAGDAWSERAGGTSGALWGALLTAVGRVLGDEEPATATTMRAGAEAALAAVQRLGGAQVGDKTMVDALAPLVATLGEQLDADQPPGEAWSAAVAAAEEGATSTSGIVAKVGRARPLGEKSVGTPDPGATSLALIAGVLGRG